MDWQFLLLVCWLKGKLMSTDCGDSASGFVKAIRESGLSIYDLVDGSNPDLLIPTEDLERLLDGGLVGRSLAGIPLRTRSKLVKTWVCETLGYPTPSSFRRTQPRFLGQSFDVYVQKSRNLQLWNEEISAARRYVLISVGDDGLIARVRVVIGAALAVLDTTGTLTGKYQARLVLGDQAAELVTLDDTDLLQPLVGQRHQSLCLDDPASPPVLGELLGISEIFDCLSSLVNEEFPDPGQDQERLRGAALHRLICQSLGYLQYRDAGTFPDVRHQLLEVKLQTSPTIDLGLVSPDSTEPLDLPFLNSQRVRYCDVRYAVFYATTDASVVTLTHFFLTTGAGFFSRFPQFQGNVLNRKLQIPLPSGFFTR